MDLYLKKQLNIVEDKLKQLNAKYVTFSYFEIIPYCNEITIKGYAKEGIVKCRWDLKDFYFNNCNVKECLECIALETFSYLEQELNRKHYITEERKPIFFDLLETKPSGKLEIKRVVFNDPATIVFWKDGTKTVVKCSKGDTFSKESGIAMCFMKKMYGNGNEYHKIFKEHTK